jgi:hypothetical protein
MFCLAHDPVSLALPSFSDYSRQSSRLHERALSENVFSSGSFLAYDGIVNQLYSFLRSASPITTKLLQFAIIEMTLPNFIMDKIESEPQGSLAKLMSLAKAEVNSLTSADVLSEIRNLDAATSVVQIFKSIMKISAAFSIYPNHAETAVMDSFETRALLREKLSRILNREDILSEYPEFTNYKHLLAHIDSSIALLEAYSILENTIVLAVNTKTFNRKFWLANILRFTLSH